MRGALGDWECGCLAFARGFLRIHVRFVKV